MTHMKTIADEYANGWSRRSGSDSDDDGDSEDLEMRIEYVPQAQRRRLETSRSAQSPTAYERERDRKLAALLAQVAETTVPGDGAATEEKQRSQSLNLPPQQQQQQLQLRQHPRHRPRSILGPVPSDDDETDGAPSANTDAGDAASQAAAQRTLTEVELRRAQQELQRMRRDDTFRRNRQLSYNAVQEVDPQSFVNLRQYRGGAGGLGGGRGRGGAPRGGQWGDRTVGRPYGRGSGGGPSNERARQFADGEGKATGEVQRPPSSARPRVVVQPGNFAWRGRTPSTGHGARGSSSHSSRHGPYPANGSS